MERLGFLQLAKRFLQLGKEAAAPEEDARYIQLRPPASRTLSLKIFNRLPPAEEIQAAAEQRNDQPQRSAGRKKFHSVKEGANSRAARKENADPRLRIASVGRKHVFAAAGGGDGRESAERLPLPPPPRKIMYQEYRTRVAQIPGINIIADGVIDNGRHSVTTAAMLAARRGGQVQEKKLTQVRRVLGYMLAFYYR